MPRYNIEHNGKWACFSSISDGFVTQFMEKGDYEAWRKEEYGRAGWQPAEECNRMTMDEAVFSASLNRDHDDLVACVQESGLPQDEVGRLVYDCETKYFVPICDNGIYKCPNCSSIVEKGQKRCHDESCLIRLVWR